jgi:sugar phosphate isomerase/epimerase
MKSQTTRRTFLSAAGIAGLAASVEPASARIEPAPWGIKLGICTYSLRSFARPQAIEMIRAIQTPWVSIKDIHLSQKAAPEEIRQARGEFETAGLKIVSGGVIYMPTDNADEIRRCFEYARNAGMPMMVVGPTHSNLKIIEGFVKEYDIRVAIHNHGPEDKQYPTPESVLEAVSGLDPRFGLCMDIGHSARTGVDVVRSIAGAGARLLDMHVKDLRDLKAKDSQCDCGDGAMPFPEIFRQLKKMNYQGCVNLEYEINGKDPLPGIQRSFSYMRGVLAGLAAA